MAWEYNPITGKRDIWVPEERTMKTGTTGTTTTGTVKNPTLIDWLGRGFSEFGQSLTKREAVPVTGQKSGTVTGTGMAGQAVTGLGSATAGAGARGIPVGTDLAAWRSNYEQATGKAPLSTTMTDGEAPGEAPTTETGITGTGEVSTSSFTPQYLYDTEKRLYDELRQYQELVATGAADNQKRALAEAIRKSQRDYQDARNALMEGSMMQERALLQGAQQRGLGGSGLEQLSRTQQRMAVGQNLNQLSQQYGDQTQQFLNTQLGIEQNLAQAMAKAALDETINVTTAMAKAMDNEWTAWQRQATMEDRTKFANQETAGLYLEYITALQNAGEDAAMKEQIRQAYKDIIPETLRTKGDALASSKQLGDVMREAESVSAPGAFMGSADRTNLEQALAREKASPNSDGKVSMLTIGTTKMYFNDDKDLTTYVRNLYANRENSASITIGVKGGKVIYTTPDGQEFDTYNKASNAIG